MNPELSPPVPPPDSPPGFGVRQSSAAFHPAPAIAGPSAKAPEDWRTPRCWRDGDDAPRLVAQVANLLDRRIPFGRPSEHRVPCGWESRVASGRHAEVERRGAFSPLTPALSPLRGEGARGGISQDVVATAARRRFEPQNENAPARRESPGSRLTSGASPSPLNGERAGVRGEAVLLTSGFFPELRRPVSDFGFGISPGALKARRWTSPGPASLRAPPWAWVGAQGTRPERARVAAASCDDPPAPLQGARVFAGVAYPGRRSRTRLPWADAPAPRWGAWFHEALSQGWRWCWPRADAPAPFHGARWRGVVSPGRRSQTRLPWADAPAPCWGAPCGGLPNDGTISDFVLWTCLGLRISDFGFSFA